MTNEMLYIGRVIKMEKDVKYDVCDEVCGAYNGGRGRYLGTYFNVHYSLYDTDVKLLKIQGDYYRFPKYFTIDIYKQVMEIMGNQRMSQKVYRKFWKYYGGKKQTILIVPEEDSFKKMGNGIEGVVYYSPCFEVNQQPIAGRQRVYLEKAV